MKDTVKQLLDSIRVITDDVEQRVATLDAKDCDTILMARTAVTLNDAKARLKEAMDMTEEVMLNMEVFEPAPATELSWENAAEKRDRRE